MAETCGAAHPTDEALYCTRALPCFLQHQAWEQAPSGLKMVASWPNPAKPPARAPSRGGIKRPAVPVIPPSAGTPQQAWQEHVGTGEQRRDTGMAQVISSTPEEYRQAFTAEYYRVMNSGQPFTSEDITRVVGMPPNHQNAVGAIFGSLNSALVKEGRVQYLRHVKAERANQNATKIGLYQKV